MTFFLSLTLIPSQLVDFLLFIFEIDIPTSNTDIGEREREREGGGERERERENLFRLEFNSIQKL